MIHPVVSRRFVKKQQMQWTLKGAYLLLKTRTKVLHNELEDVFRRWFPRFRPKAQTTSPEQKAAWSCQEFCVKRRSEPLDPPVPGALAVAIYSCAYATA
jgi:hypothetical protein